MRVVPTGATRFCRLSTEIVVFRRYVRGLRREAVEPHGGAGGEALVGETSGIVELSDLQIIGSTLTLRAPRPLVGARCKDRRPHPHTCSKIKTGHDSPPVGTAVATRRFEYEHIKVFLCTT